MDTEMKNIAYLRERLCRGMEFTELRVTDRGHISVYMRDLVGSLPTVVIPERWLGEHKISKAGLLPAFLMWLNANDIPYVNRLTNTVWSSADPKNQYLTWMLDGKWHTRCAMGADREPMSATYRYWRVSFDLWKDPQDFMEHLKDEVQGIESITFDVSGYTTIKKVLFWDEAYPKQEWWPAWFPRSKSFESLGVINDRSMPPM